MKEDERRKALTPSGKRGRMRTIALEEHFVTPAYMEGPGHQMLERANAANASAETNLLVQRLSDIGDSRIAAMDAAGIDIQALSLNAPGTEMLEAKEALILARDTNDRVAEAMKRYPGRFIGLACLPTATPEMAALELERLVSKFGFKGAAINGHIRGRYLDDNFFWPILESAEALGVPIYIHPTPPPEAVIKAYYTGNFSTQVSSALLRAAWGWHIETATHVLRLILSGAFDKFVNLQIMIGHMGEALPFMLPRIDTYLPRQLTKLQRPVAAYLRENIYYSFSGFNYIHCFLDLFLQMGVDRIVFSTDYPHQTMESAITFLDQLPISPADKERIAHGNAERLLKI
jgi:predicted TIM-barrel fold metal-dependent hydrolase